MILAGLEIMSYDQIEQVLASVTYKPGWKITVERRSEGPMIRITAKLPNAYRPSDTTVLGINSYPSPQHLMSSTGLLDWLSWRLGRIELHEKDEWLKVDGKPYQDPHADDYWVNGVEG